MAEIYDVTDQRVLDYCSAFVSEEDETFENPFLFANNMLSNSGHEVFGAGYDDRVLKNSTFAKATGSMYDIKKFLETHLDTTLAYVYIIYASTPHFIPQYIFQELTPEMEQQWKDVQCSLKFNYFGWTAPESFTSFFAPYGLEFSQAQAG